MKRIAGLDIVRVIAILFVISVHYFRNTTFYSIPTTGKTTGILLAFRWLFYTCVPLFIILTGYLSRNKEPNKKYYSGIKKVLISYFFISIICIIVRIFCFKEERRILYWLISPLNFTADGYSWYIEMYIGLFLLAPFLNVLYKGLDTKEKKQLLIVTLLILTGFPAVFNNYNILGLNKVEIFPNWWKEIYPITYYFIGSYIGEYKPKANKKYTILYILLVLLIQTSCFYLLVDGKSFSYNFYNGYGSALTTILSILIFITFYDIDIKKQILFKINYINIVMFPRYVSILIFNRFENIRKTKRKFINPKRIIVAYDTNNYYSVCNMLSRLFNKKIIFEIPEKIKNFKKTQKT